MEWLKKLIGEELYNQIAPKLGGKTLLLQEKEGDYIPKQRFDEVNSKKSELEKEINTAKEKLTKLQTDFDSLKNEKDSGKTEVEKQLADLTKQLTDLKSANDLKDKELLLQKKQTAIKEALTEAKANPKYLQLLTKEFDVDKIEFDESGKLKGIAELIKPVQENFKDLFGEKKLTGNNHTPGSNNEETITEMNPVDYFASKAAH
jgi:DNA repair exonuclease SbcCD ATPase subunit